MPPPHVGWTGVRRTACSRESFKRAMSHDDSCATSVRRSRVDAASTDSRSIEAQLAALVAAAQPSIALFDTSMRYLAASANWSRQYGVEGQELVGRVHYEVFPEIPERWKEMHRRGIAGEVLTSDSDLFAREQGHLHRMRWSIVPWRHEQGAIGGIAITSVDLSELHRQRADAERVRREFELLFENAGTAIVVTDLAGRIERASSTFARLTGRSAHGLVGVGFLDMLAPESSGLQSERRDFLAMFGALRAFETTKAAGRARVRSIDGSDRWVHCSAVRLDAGISAVSRIVVFLEDKSEAVVLERKMREADRIASLGMLGAGLGHELGNVLLPMQAHLNALQVGIARGAASDALADHLTAIGVGISYLRDLADGMHYLGRGEQDARALAPGAFASGVSASDGPASEAPAPEGTLPAEWWPQVERLIRCAIPSATKLDVRIDDACPRIGMQPSMLLQSLVNLLVNARDAIIERHGPRGVGGEIEIAFDSVGHGNDRGARVRVSDNGTGMNESTIARAREPFYTTKPAGRGTGLGLAMVSSATAQAGGLLSIESAVGVGTEIALLLPAARRVR